MQGFIQTWAGECSAWECDDLGHLNMRHYMTKVRQARQMMVIRLGLDEAFKIDAVSSVRVRDFHIKYMGEARPGDPLRIETAVLNVGECEARLCHIMYHASGKLAASVVETIDHVYLRTQNVFPWPQRFRKNAKAFTAQAQPQPTQPRGFTYGEPALQPIESQLQDWNVPRIGAGVFQTAETGIDGRVGAQPLLGRTTETIGHFKQAWPELHDADYREAGGSGALLEAMVTLGAPAEAGDAYHFYSGIHSANPYTRRLLHNIVNVVTGENIFSMTGIACLFNLNTRKLIKTDPAQVAALNSVSIPAFSV